MMGILVAKGLIRKCDENVSTQHCYTNHVIKEEGKFCMLDYVGNEIESFIIHLSRSHGNCDSLHEM